ncbi:unnamed protein product, partial [Rotaria sp. Silwood1]
ATGGILKKMWEQKQSLLYAIIFKDVTDSNDTIPLAHAILTDHTVPSIGYFFANVAHKIDQIKSKLVLPSFFIIDFSPAIMNATLQAFNEENINTHLNRCWNVICGKYNAKQLRSLSLIHFCCCHVIHAIARSLTTAQIDKKIRRGVLYIFAFILCSNDIKQLYNILGSVINIFGDPDEQNAKENFERLVSLQLDVDEETAHCGRIYLRSSAPIIHQSPFNQEAIRLYPNPATLINHKSKSDKSTNPLFSPSIIRIFYRWWAYLPLWTDLLLNFNERYSNDIITNLSVMHYPIRHSNALIESYFRTLKKSILQGKVNNRPFSVILESYRSIKTQFKANKFEVTQSSKGRKRKKKNTTLEEKSTIEVNWGKAANDQTGRTTYMKLIDKFASKRARIKMNDTQSDYVAKKFSESEDATTVSSLNRSISSSNVSSDSISSEKSSELSKSCSVSPSSESDSMVSSEYSNNVRISLGKPTADDDEQSEISNKFNFDTNTMSSIVDMLYPVDLAPLVTTDQSFKMPHCQRSSQPETIIDGHVLRWPNAPETSSYSTLVKIFHLVEKEGWDAARISWLLNFHLLKPTDQQPKSLFGSADEQVFCFIKDNQRHSNTITCTNLQCTDKERNYSTTELRFFPFDDHIEKFEAETMGICTAMIKRYDEMTEVEALKNKYKDGRVPFVNYETNENGYM